MEHHGPAPEDAILASPAIGEGLGALADGTPEAPDAPEFAALHLARAQLVEGMQSQVENVGELFLAYSDALEAMVARTELAQRTDGQIAVLVQMALVRRDGGRLSDYRADLDDILAYAQNMGFDAIVAATLRDMAEYDNSGTVEQAPGEPTPEAVGAACGQALSAELCSEIASQETLEEAISLACVLLDDPDSASPTIDDPMSYLLERGILQ